MANNSSINIVINAVNNAKRALSEASTDLNEIKNTANNAKNALLGMFGISIGGGFVKDLAEAADKWLSINAQIRNATKSNDEFVAAQSAVIDISKSTYTSLEANAGLFSKINLALSAMGGNSQQSIGAVDQIAKLVALSGTSAESAAAGIFQFTQSLAANRFSGQEYNSVAEQTPALLKAIYEGLGVNIGQLRKLAEEGTLDTATVLGAIEKSTERTNAAFAKLPITLSKASQNMSNSWLVFVGRLNESSGITGTLAAGINRLAGNMTALGELAIDVFAALAFAGAVKGIAVISSLTAAFQMSALQAKANAVANAQAQAADEAAILVLKEKVASQLADIRASIARTQANMAQTRVEIANTQAMLANTVSLQTKQTLVARITLLNAELTASTAILNEQLAAQNAVLSVGNVKWLSFSTALNVALAGFAGYEIGSWARENFAWVDKVQIRIEELIEKAAYFTKKENFTLNPVQIYEDIAGIEEEYQGYYDNTSKLSIKEREEFAANQKAQVEEAKKAAEQKANAFAEGFKKSSQRVSDLNEINKQSYERDLRNLEIAEQQRIRLINESAVNQASTQNFRDNLLVQAQIEFNQKRLQTTIDYQTKYLASVTQLYANEIATQKSRNLNTDNLEKESANAKKAVLLEIEKAYEASIAKLITEDQKHRDKALGYLKEIEATQQRKTEKIRDLDAIGLSDAEQVETKKRLLAQDTALYEQLIKQGAFDKALELSKKNEELAFDIAAAEKKAAADGSGETYKADLARQAYLKTLDQTAAAQQLAGSAELKNSENIRAAIDDNKKSLEGVRTQIAELNADIKSISNIGLKVDSSEIDTAKAKLDALPTEKTVTIKTVEAHNAGGFVGMIRRFAGGGAVPGSGSSDTVPAMLTPGEFVLRKAAVERLSPQFLTALNSGKLNNTPTQSLGSYDLNLTHGDINLPASVSAKNQDVLKTLIAQLQQQKRVQR